MEKHIIGRGLLAGVLAGVFAFVFARIFVEPIVERAIGFEDAVAGAHEAMETASGHGHSHEEGVAVFTRDIQANIGIGTGLVLFSVAIAALFAVVFCVTYGRVAGLSARVTAVLVAGAMLVALWIVPALKYPPNPPAVSLDQTIDERTLWYLVLVVLSAALMVAAVYLGRALAARFGAWNAVLAAAGSYVVAVVVAMLVLPTVDETPGPMVDDAGTILLGGFPADDLYEFRLYAFITQVIIFGTIGLVSAQLFAKVLDERPVTAAA